MHLRILSKGKGLWLESRLTEYWKATGNVILRPTIKRGSRNTSRFIPHTPVREDDNQVVWMARSDEYLPLGPQIGHHHVAFLHPSDKWT